jgi:2-phospho-L-lactate/phosphoenolpyruvate guanylyltransferase
VETKQHRSAALVPIKDFTQAKARLSGVLSSIERIELAQELAAGVLHACSGFDLFVVCDAPAVADFAHDHGATVIWTPEIGLNAAVRLGVDHLSALGYPSILISHADLADPATIGSLPDHDGVMIVPDHRHDGTNVMRVPRSCSFDFHYGARSSHRHEAAARSAGYEVLVVHDEALSHDVDDAADLARYRA